MQPLPPSCRGTFSNAVDCPCRWFVGGSGFTNNLRTCSVYYSGPKLLAGRGARRARPSSGRQEVSGRGVTTERVTVDRRLGRHGVTPYRWLNSSAASQFFNNPESLGER